MSRLGTHHIETTTLAAEVAAADRVARALVAGFGFCAGAGWPLSELQRVELIKAALLEFDGFGGEVTAMLDMERLLSRGLSNGSGA